MVEERYSGRRFSQWVERSYSSDDPGDLERFADDWRSVPPFEKQIEANVERARAFLRKKGLPDSGVALDQMIEKEYGLPRDSFEHLAAQFIVAAEDMRHPRRDIALWGAFRLGRLDVLTNIYSGETIDAKRRGGKSKRRAWADDLADYLVNRGARNEAEAWKNAPPPNSPLKLSEDRHVYVDGERVTCVDPVTERERTLAWQTFAKRYLGPKMSGQKRR